MATNPNLNPGLNPHAIPLPTPRNPETISQPLISTPEPWTKKLFSLTHIPELQRLVFTPPVRKGDKVIAICSKEEVNRTEAVWKDAIHGFFADKRPFFPSILSALKRSWKVKGSVEIFQRPDDSIIFVFSSLDERNRILGSGPWFILGRYLHLRPWSRSVRSRKDFFETLPIWIRFPNLPLHLWSPSSIGKISSVVGKPLYLDNYSANASKIRFVRVCVEISAEKSPPSSVQVEVEGSPDPPFDQIVEYESSFKICEECKVFGHLVGDCDKDPSLSSLAPRKNQANKQSPKQATSSKTTDEYILPDLPSVIKTAEKLKDLPSESGWTLIQRKKSKNQPKQTVVQFESQAQGKLSIPEKGGISSTEFCKSGGARLSAGNLAARNLNSVGISVSSAGGLDPEPSEPGVCTGQTRESDMHQKAGVPDPIIEPYLVYDAVEPHLTVDVSFPSTGLANNPDASLDSDVLNESSRPDDPDESIVISVANLHKQTQNSDAKKLVCDSTTASLDPAAKELHLREDLVFNYGGSVVLLETENLDPVIQQVLDNPSVALPQVSNLNISVGKPISHSAQTLTVNPKPKPLAKSTPNPLPFNQTTLTPLSTHFQPISPFRENRSINTTMGEQLDSSLGQGIPRGNLLGNSSIASSSTCLVLEAPLDLYFANSKSISPLAGTVKELHGVQESRISDVHGNMPSRSFDVVESSCDQGNLYQPKTASVVDPREKSAILHYFATNNREVAVLSEEDDGESGPPGFNSRTDKSSEENTMETAIHVTEENSSSEEDFNGVSCSRAKMVRENLGISILGTDDADKAFADFCRNRQKENEIIRKKSVVPDVSINLKKHVGKKGNLSRRGVEGRKKKVRSEGA